MPAPAPSTPRLLVLHSRYGWHLEPYLETLTSGSFRVKLIVLRDDHPLAAMPDGLAERTQRRSMGFPGIRVRDYTPRRLWRLCRVLFREVRAADGVLTGTQNPVHSKVAWLMARLFRKPLMLEVEQWRDYPPTTTLHGLYDRLSIALLRGADRCFVHGAHARDFALRSGARPERVHVYPFTSADLGEHVRIVPARDPGCRFLFVGRLVDVKGVDLLLKAYASVTREFPESTLRICGDGPLRRNLERLADDLDLTVDFLGWLAPGGVESVLANCDVLVLPSRVTSAGEYEGWGLVVEEAASLGKAIIVSTAVGSAPEFVAEGENGHVVREGDAGGFARAMCDLARDVRRTRGMGAASRALFEAYNQPLTCVRLVEQVFMESSIHIPSA
jgi:glycosyltransferase involved in cell wall biosynthesis